MATLYFDPATVELPAVGETFDVALKYRGTLSDVEGFEINIGYDDSVIYYDNFISVVQAVDFSATRFSRYSDTDARSGVAFRSGKTRTSARPFDPLVSGTNLIIIDMRFEVLERRATALSVFVDEYFVGFFGNYAPLSGIFVSDGETLIPNEFSIPLTVNGQAPTTTLTVPTVPTHLLITAGDGELTANWEASASNGGAPIDRYEVRIHDDPWIDVGPDGRSWTFRGLPNAEIATIAVRSHNRLGYSAVATAKETPVAAPVQLPTPVTSLNPFSYQGHPLRVAVKIHDQDVTDDTAWVDDIQRGVDYPNLTEFRIGEASLTLRDVHGAYSPNNPSNFFTQHGGHRTGRHSPVEIEAGFIVNGNPRHTQTIFKGTIIRIVQDAKPATVKVICADGVGGLRSDALTNFGIPRHFMLTEAVPQSRENGVYPIMDAILPASHGSVSLATHVGETLQPKQKLETEGTLNPRNFVVDAEGVRTEGGAITGAQRGYPQLRMKSPYRYRHIDDVIRDILRHAGITDSEIAIPAQTVDPHFSSNGRVNYDLLGTIGSSNPITWNGYVTDFLYDSANEKWYFLYNGHRGNPNGISQVIQYDETTRTYRQLHKFSSTTEVWTFTKSGNNFYILSSTGGNYDAKENSCRTQILQLDISDTPTETVFVPHTNSLRPQLSHYYAGVGSVFMKPDSRKPLIYRQNDGLYYAYCKGDTQFGIAKATAPNRSTAVITINHDDHGNHAGISFDIKNNTLRGATTFLSGGKSQILTFEKSL